MKDKMNKDINNLYSAILMLKNQTESRKFFRDLLTQEEIDEFANRWKVARMLDKNIPYETITKATGMSSTTIARISKWLNSGMGGYKMLIDRLHSHHNRSTRLRED